MEGRTVKFAGQLYQLRHASLLSKGTYVEMAECPDSFGVVLGNQAIGKGPYMHLIRGVQQKPELSPEVVFSA